MTKPIHANGAIVQELFTNRRFSKAPAPGFLAKAGCPADGFEPFKTDRGTEVLFIPNPAQLRHPLSLNITPQWRNALGLVVARHEASDTVNAIFIHGVRRTPWSAIQPNAWQALGGVMAFQGISFERALDMVVGKGYAMTPKWGYIDMSLEQVNHPTLTNLGGGKQIILHGPSVGDKHAGIVIAAEVAVILGIYISGCDQNTGLDEKNGINWGDKYAELAPFNFMGAKTAGLGYTGMKNPSPFTARGVFAGLTVIKQELTGQDAPIFIQGCGGVGRVLIADAVKNGWPISGVVEAEVSKLLNVRRDGLKAPIYLDAAATEAAFDKERRAEEEKLARENGIPVVEGLIEAMELSRKQGLPTVILSPNAGPHPITREIAEYLVASGVKAVAGAANNTLGLENGSPETIAWLLQKGGIFAPNDSRINRMGAMSVTVESIQLGAVGLARQEVAVGEGVRDEIVNAYRHGIPPQLYSEQLAAARHNDALTTGDAQGGWFDVRPIIAPPEKQRCPTT